MTEPSAPAPWIRTLGRALPARYRAEVLADLLEERDAMTGAGASRSRAAAWLAAHLVRSAVASRRAGWRVDRAAMARSAARWRSLAPASEWRQAIRALRRAPVYAATVVAVMALAIALAATVLAVVDGVLFKPLPYPDPGAIYVVSGRHDADAGPPDRGVGMTSPAEVAAWSAASPEVAITSVGYSSVSFPDGTIVFAAAIDRSFFDVFGVRLLMGGFRDEDYLVEGPVMPIVISNRLWRERFERDPGVIGRAIPAFGQFGRPLQVVGVMDEDGFVPPLPGPSAGVRLPTRVDVLRPPFTEALGERSSVAYTRIPATRWIEGRAAIDRAVAAFRAAAPPPRPNLSPVARRISAAYDSVDLLPLRDYVASRERAGFALAFGMAMSLVVLVMLNAGALAAARAQQRTRDLALRRAIGARTRDLLRHALTEQMLLAVAGAVVGLLAAPLLLALVLDRLPPGLTLIKDVRLDWRVMAFSGVLSGASAFVVALMSVWVAVRHARVAFTLANAHGRTPARARVGRLLVAGQTTIAFALVLGGALFASSLAQVWREDPGIDTEGALTLRVAYPEYPSPTQAARTLALVQGLRDTPGVRGAALLDASIMRNFERRSPFFERPPSADPSAIVPATVRVGSGFFAATGVRLVAGRLPSDAELDAGAPVVVVSESVARAYWPGRSAVGQSLRAGRGTRAIDCLVVGVVRDVRFSALDVPSNGVVFASVLLPAASTSGARYVYVRMPSAMPGALALVRERVAALDPAVVVMDLRWLADDMADSIRERRLAALAASVFGGVAVVFVALGLLGLVTMTSSRRTREVGIRLTLGAERGSVARLLVGEQVGAVGAGLVAGGVLAAWVMPVVDAQLYGVSVYDAGVWVTSVAVIIATAVLSAWLPARRASRIDPVASLRDA